MNLLIVEDEVQLADALAEILYRNKYHVDTVYNGEDGLHYASTGIYDCIVLDIMLPILDGISVLRMLRKQKISTPVLLLTAKSDVADKINGLDSGADDYLTKPFGINELLARVNSLIRRYTTLNPFTADIDSISLKDMVIDKLNRTVTVKDIPVLLTGKEFDLLLFLASNKGRVFTKKQIYSQVWEEEYAFDDSNIMSFISKLRKKIEPDPDHPFYILTVRGVGYRFNKEA